MADPLIPPRQNLLRQVELLLGGDIIDLELDQTHFDVALDVAIGRYRQRSGNALEESYLFLDVQPDIATYRLPDEVQEVRSVYRRSMAGISSGAGADPFALAWTNSMYMMQGGGGLGGGSGSLATYDFAMQYQSLVGRMFGRDVMFTWEASTKTLTLERRFGVLEQVALHVYNTRPESVLLNDPYAAPWLREYTIATCKFMMGEARSKFSSIAGPQGGFQLNGDAMKQEARADLDRLEQELIMFVDQHVGMPITIG